MNMKEALRYNVRNKTFLLWNGGIAAAHEYVSDWQPPAGYCRLVIDRLALYDRSHLPGIAGRIEFAHRLLNGAGVIEEDAGTTSLRPLSADEYRQLWQELAKAL